MLVTSVANLITPCSVFRSKSLEIIVGKELNLYGSTLLVAVYLIISPLSLITATPLSTTILQFY